MICILGHNFKIIASGLGGYSYCGVIIANDMPMVKLICTKCGKEEIKESI